MCGRYAITLPPEAVRRFFRYLEQPNFPPRYNIAPTQPVPIVRGRIGTGRRARAPLRSRPLGLFAALRQGSASVSADLQRPLRNAAEQGELQERVQAPPMPVHRRRLLRMAARPGGRPRAALSVSALRRRPAWPRRHFRELGRPERRGGRYRLHHHDAGQWTAARRSTTGCPRSSSPEAFDLWLDPDEARADAAFALLSPPGDDVLRFFEIGAAVNKAANDFAEVQRPVGAGAVAPERPAASAPEPAEPAQRSLF